VLNEKARAATWLAEAMVLAELHDVKAPSAPCSCVLTESGMCPERIEIQSRIDFALQAYMEADSKVGEEREPIASRRNGYTQKMSVEDSGVIDETGEPQSLYVRTGEYEDGRVAEIFIDLNKTGGTLRGAFSSLAIAVSLGLQHGVPLQEFVDAFVGMSFEPRGPVSGHAKITRADSLVDLIFHDLALSYGADLPASSAWRRLTDV